MLDTLERARANEQRFVADASHELRTPLTALRGNVEHLARHGASPELVADLQADAARLARLADDLLVLSREDAGALARRRGSPRRAGPPGRRRRGGHGACHRARRPRRACARARQPRRERARCTDAAASSCASARARRSGARVEVEDEGAGIAAPTASASSSGFTVEARGSASRSSRATAERHGGRAYVDGVEIHARAADRHEYLQTVWVSLTVRHSEKGLP